MGEQRCKKELLNAPAKPDDTSHKLWVVAVMAFWISAGITLAFTLFTGKLDLILLSITCGMMVLGVGLKVRYQLQQRKARGRIPEEDLP